MPVSSPSEKWSGSRDSHVTYRRSERLQIVVVSTHIMYFGGRGECGTLMPDWEELMADAKHSGRRPASPLLARHHTPRTPAPPPELVWVFSHEALAFSV